MNVEIVLDGLENNPQCFHGPCLLFKRNGAKVKEYYACSASRDHKECPFFMEVSNKKLNKNSKWISIRAETVQNIILKNPYKKYLKILKSIKAQNSSQQKMKVGKAMKSTKSRHSFQETCKEYEMTSKGLRLMCDNLKAKSNHSAGYCYTCEALFLGSEIENHRNCKTVENLTYYQLQHPTEFLIPKEDSKTHAQYFFSKETVKNIVVLLSRLEVSKVLCIGAPRIHEYLMNECKNQFQSVLLDIDLKYEDCVKTLEEFLQFKEVTVLMDPPFGGRVEPLANTLKALNKLYLNLNGLNKHRGNGEEGLKIMWIFPYFMKRHIQASLPDFKMSDLKIDYENHKSFTSTGNRKRKHGSPVRIFTNVPLSRLNMDGIGGYKFCESCGYWVSSENRHCDKCNSCTSKNGTTYQHCESCSRCVKPSFRHCNICGMCRLADHDCNILEPAQNCFHCKLPGHKKRDCPEAEKSAKRRRKKNNVQI